MSFLSSIRGKTARDPIGADQAPDRVDTSPTDDDGPQDVTQDHEYDEADSDEPDNDDDDPEVAEVF